MEVSGAEHSAGGQRPGLAWPSFGPFKLGQRSLEFGSGPSASSRVGLKNTLVAIYIHTNT